MLWVPIGNVLVRCMLQVTIESVSVRCILWRDAGDKKSTRPLVITSEI